MITWLAIALPVQAQMLDRVLVVVNDDIITLGEFEKALTEMRSKLAQAGQAAPSERELREKVIEQMVFEKLLQLHAGDTGINVSEAMLDEATKNLARQNNLSEEQLLRQLKEDDISAEEFRKNLKNQLLIQRVIDRDVKRQISVLDSEVDAILGNLSQGQANRSYNISHIQLAINDETSADEIEKVTKRGEDLRRQILAGEISFEDAAIRYSRAGTAEDGGKLGWKTKAQLPALFAEALSNMKVGDISAPLVSPGGIHLLKLNELKGAQQKLLSQTRARHILLKAKNKVDIQHAQGELSKIRERILGGEDFAVLATEISQDPGSAIKGGDLGWLNKGDTVPGFEKAMDAMQIGEISQPVVSQFGVHLIQVQERRQQDVSEQNQRDMIREQIGRRKIAEKYEQFLKQLKSKAFIDYRTPIDEI